MPAQLAYAGQVAGASRAVWNTGLDQRRQYRQRGAWINYQQQAKELAEAKTDPDLAWLKGVPGHCLQQTLMDLDKACRSHGTWAVNFRDKDRWSPSFRFPEGKHMRVVRLSKRWGQVNLPKFGQVRFRMTREIGGTIRSATITRDGVKGGWFISVLVEDGILQANPSTPDLRPTVGVDRGVKVALALSDGLMLDQTFITDAETARVKTLQRKAARQRGPRTPGSTGRKGRRQPSKRWQRTQKQIAKIQARQRRRRDDFTTKTAHSLAAGHSLVAVEDLKIANMTRRAKPVPDPDRPDVFLPNRAAQKSGLNRAILAKGWGKFLLALNHQARYTGTEIVLVPAAFTSLRCYECGHTEPGNRENQAAFHCIRCGHTAHADLNAARNILAAGLAATGRVRPGISGSVNHQAA
ncbi:MAG: transposase [Actinomycetota bacterium]|nr:transposase [Actinomycetota bacterium]